jgi:hypothetical protein
MPFILAYPWLLLDTTGDVQHRSWLGVLPVAVFFIIPFF